MAYRGGDGLAPSAAPVESQGHPLSRHPKTTLAKVPSYVHQTASNCRKQDGDTKQIPLSRGYVAIVDDEDYEWASRYNWFALDKPDGGDAAWTDRVQGD